MKIITLSEYPFFACCYAVVENGTGVIIDPCVPVERIIELEKAEQVRFTHIIMTHGHFDHISNLDEIKEHTGAEVCISREDAIMLSDPMANASAMFRGIPHISCSTAPDRFLSDNDEIVCGDIHLEVIASPGHSKGSIMLLSGDKLFSGDTLFDGNYGRYDLYGGDKQVLFSTLRSASSFCGKGIMLYPGHGNSASFDDAYKKIMRIL